jgi:hypothetical protein
MNSLYSTGEVPAELKKEKIEIQESESNQI